MAERQRLSPLAIPPAQYALRIVVTVTTTGFVEYNGIRYSMPPETIGIPGTLFLYPDRVRIVTRDGTQAEHPRWPETGDTSYRSQVINHRYLRKKPMLLTTNPPWADSTSGAMCCTTPTWPRPSPTASWNADGSFNFADRLVERVI